MHFWTMNIDNQNSEVILLSKYNSDRVHVERLLDKLEAIGVVSYVIQKRNTLSFFAEEVTPPSIIVMFMDHQETFGIHFSQNFFLLMLQEFGASRYYFLDTFPVHILGKGKTDLLETVLHLSAQQTYPMYCYN